MRTLTLIAISLLLAACTNNPHINVSHLERHCARQALAGYSQCVDNNFLGTTPMAPCKHKLHLDLQTCPPR